MHNWSDAPQSKADVDRQRAEVHRADPSAGFLARLDAAIVAAAHEIGAGTAAR